MEIKGYKVPLQDITLFICMITQWIGILIDDYWTEEISRPTVLGLLSVFYTYNYRL